MVVAQILGLCTYIYRSHYLLRPELVHCIAGLFAYPLRQNRLFVIHRLRSLYQPVTPFDGVNILNTQDGRRQFHAAFHISGLGNKVVTGIVHNAGRGAILLCKRRAAQAIHGKCKAGTHVMHQSKRVPYFVRRDISHRFLHHLVVKCFLVRAVVNGPRLHKPPVMQQADDVVIPDNVGRQYLTRARIHIAWSHGIGGFGNGIFHTAVTHIVRIECRIVLRIVANLHNVLETGGFERGIPVENALLYRAAPLLRKGRIDIENNGLLRLYQLTGEIFLTVTVARFDAPAMNNAPFVNAIGLRTIHLLVGREIAYAPIVQAGTHQCVGRTVKRAVHYHRIGLVVARQRKREQGFYFDIQREILHLADA